MGTKSKEKIKTLSLIEAVETLSNIADLKLEREAAVTEKHALLFDDQKINYRTIHWLKDAESERTLGIIREVFRVILSHLKNTWQSQFQLVTPIEKIESIKTIMILVGEAAKKLDRYTELFNETKEKSVTDLKEYLELKRFYQSKISHVIDEGVLSKWLFSLTKAFIEQKKMKLKGEGQTISDHVYIDLDQIKNDSAYELLFIRKEDGSRFFNPRLIRNMKLVIDFGGSLGSIEDDSLKGLALWNDSIAHISAKTMLRSIGSKLDLFFKETAKHRTKPLPQLVSSAIMALFLAAASENSIKHIKVKTCVDYLVDFEKYLHAALTSSEYKKMAAYPPKSNNHLGTVLLQTINSLVRAFFIHFDGFKEMLPVIDGLIPPEGKKSDLPLNKALELDHENFRKAIKSQMHGPMNRNVDMIENWETSFSPLMQKNWPTGLFSLYVGSKRILCMKLPTPTDQGYIHKAHVIEEFLAFLRASKNDQDIKKHLMFNLQDRTSWKEIARCKALETLGNNSEFEKQFAIATLAFDTDFYHQLPPYDQDRQFKVFAEHFIEQLTDENTGFYFQKDLANALKPKFLKDVIDGVSRLFFHSKNTLSRNERLDFISITYLMLYLKCMEENHPDSISFTCKDCIDLGITQSALLFTFFKLMQNGMLTKEDIAALHHILFSHALLVRERTILQERFFRMTSAIGVLERASQEYGKDHFKRIIDEAFGQLIGKNILHCQI